jgi:hypothetical protein
MRRFLIATFIAAAFGLQGAPALEGQEYRSGVGWFGGAAYSTSLNSGVPVDAEDMLPGLSWTAGGHYDYWLGGGRFGVRFQGAWQRHTIPWNQGDRNVSMISGDIDVTVRLTSPEPGRTVTPYLLLGGGFVRWALGSGAPTSYPQGGVSYGGSEEFQPVAVGGLGFDFRTPITWGDQPLVVRLEGRDHVQFRSPFDAIDPSVGDLGMVHNISITLGLYTGIGGL